MTEAQEPTGRAYSLRELAETAKLLHAGKRDQVQVLTKNVAEGKVRRTQHDIERIAAPLPALFRIARALYVMSERRGELPPWLIELLEHGAE